MAYPDTLDVLAADKTNDTPAPADHPDHHNALANAISATQAELGLVPSGSSATLTERLQYLSVATSGQRVTTGASTSSLGTPATWRGLTIARSGSLDFDGTGGGSNHRVYVETKVGNGTNGTRGDSITSPNANLGAHSSMSCFFAWGDGSASFDDKGSLHHYTSIMAIEPYSGGGDVYCEGLNFYGEIDMNRKGGFATNSELINTVAAGAAARNCVYRGIIVENNALSAYDASTVPASWQRTGARIIDLQAGGTQRVGTGIYIEGGAGYEWFIQCENGAGTRVSGIDGNGGVFTRTKAGVPVNGDFRQPTDGLLAVDTTNHHLYFRSGGAWRRLVPA